MMHSGVGAFGGAPSFLTFEDFVITNFEGISVSTAVIMLALAILRYASASGKQSSDVAKSALEVASQVSAGRERQIEALDRNTEALQTGQAATSTLITSLTANLDTIGRASLKEHQETQNIATAIQTSVTTLVTDFAELKTIMNSALDSVKDNASSVAALALRMSALDNTLQQLVEKVYPNPDDTQEIPEILQRTARAITDANLAPEVNPT